MPSRKINIDTNHYLHLNFKDEKDFNEKLTQLKKEHNKMKHDIKDGEYFLSK